MVTTPRQELKLLEEELKQNVPEPLHSMLEKETKDEAIDKHKARKQKETVICGPTCTGEGLSVILKKFKSQYFPIRKLFYSLTVTLTNSLNTIPLCRQLLVSAIPVLGGPAKAEWAPGKEEEEFLFYFNLSPLPLPFTFFFSLPYSQQGVACRRGQLNTKNLSSMISSQFLSAGTKMMFALKFSG